MAKQKRQQFNLVPVEGLVINKPSRTLTETSVRFHPVRVLAFVVSHFTPVTDFHVMAGLHYVGNVVLRVYLEHDKCNFRSWFFFFFFTTFKHVCFIHYTTCINHVHRYVEKELLCSLNGISPLRFIIPSSDIFYTINLLVNIVYTLCDWTFLFFNHEKLRKIHLYCNTLYRYYKIHLRFPYTGWFIITNHLKI